MSEVSMRWPASPGERFAPGCFDDQLGRPVPLRLGRDRHGDAILLSYEVAADGTSVDVTFTLVAPGGSTEPPPDAT